MNGQEEIDLLKLLQALWKKAWIIVAAAVAGGILFLLYTYFMVTPQYKTSALLYVNNSSVNIGNTKVNITSSDIYASNSLVETFSVILKSRNTLEDAISEGQLNYTYEQLVNKVSGSSEGETAVFKITTVDSDPATAAHITNTIVEVITEKISDIVEGSSVKVVDYAVPPTKAFSPSYLKNTAIGMLLGFVIACGIIILRSLMDSTIREEDFLLDKYKDIPVLASVPDLAADAHGGYGYSRGYSQAYAKSHDKAKKAASERQRQEREERQNAYTRKEEEESSPFVSGGAGTNPAGTNATNANATNTTRGSGV